MKIVTPKVIKNCPYTAIITYPPTEPHKNTFFKIMYVESGSAILTLFSKKGKKEIQTIQKQTNQKILNMAILIACNNPFLMGILCKKYHRPTN